MAGPRVPLADRFWSKVLKTDGCWLWTAQRQQNKPFKDGLGYGCFAYYSKGLKRPSRNMHAHRVAWTLTYGEIPDGLRVLHTCDNTACCRPDHLFLGTQKDNMADAAAKGRTRHDTASRSSLTPDDVRAIRADPRRHHLIAANYGLKERTSVWLIKHRKTFAWIDGPPSVHSRPGRYTANVFVCQSTTSVPRLAS